MPLYNPAGSGDLVSTNNLSDLANAGTARTNLGLGSLATLSAVASAQITDGTIVAGDLAAAAVTLPKVELGLAALPSMDYTGSFYRANISRAQANSTSTSVLTTQVMSSFAVYLAAGEVVTNLSFLSSGQAAGTPTNWWFALYDTQATPALIAQSADQTSTAWAADTVKTLALSSPYTVTTSGVHYASIMMKATTVVGLRGFTASSISGAALLTGQKAVTVTSGSSLTTTAPSTIASPTTNTFTVIVMLT